MRFFRLVAIADSSVDDNGAAGIVGGGCGFGGRNTSANGNGSHGFYVGRDFGGVRFRDCSASNDTLDGIHFDRLEGLGLTISGGTFNGNGDGVRFDDQRFMIGVRGKIIGAEITGNVANGVFIGPDEPIDRITLNRVMLDGNGAVAGLSRCELGHLLGRLTTSSPWRFTSP